MALGGPVCSAIATAFMTQAEEMLQDMKDLCHQWDCLAQEAGKAEKEWEKMCQQVQDLRSVVRGELESLEHELQSKKDKLAQLEAQKRNVGGLWFCTWSISQGSRNVNGCFS